MFKQFPRLVAAGLLTGWFILPASAPASSCKALDQNACAADAGCKWVAAYQRSDGRSVKAHCRSLPRKSDAPDLAARASAKKDN